MIYLHVPFCRSFCTYCGFYSEAVPACPGNGDMARFDRYADSVCAEIVSRADEIRSTLPTGALSGKIDTLYIGGGTPSVLPLSVVSRIVHTLNNTVFGEQYHDYLEFTFEVNPEDVVEKGEEYLKGLMALGVNRFSMGIQSFDDRILRWMNRRHNAEHAEDAYWMMRGLNVRNISIDLIFGVDGLSDATWEATLHKAIGLSPSHISAYQLSVEDGSALSRLVADGKYHEAGEDVCRRQYDMLCSMLYEAGYHHYEVSNFAFPGMEARHNSAYWRRVPYVGLGPGAHSALADAEGKVNVRRWNTETESGYVSELETLSEGDIKVEKIMLGLRTDDGVDPALLPEKVVARLMKEGALAKNVWGKIRIPEDHFFVSDEIITELI